MREKMVLAAALTFSLYLFSVAGGSIKSAKSPVPQTPGTPSQAFRNLPRYSLMHLPRWSSAANPVYH